MIKDQIDFLVSTPLLNKNKNNINSTKKLQVYFNHALSCIEFTAKLNANLDSAKVSNITLTNLSNSGKIEYNDMSFIWTDLSSTLVNYNLSKESGLNNRAFTVKNEVKSILDDNHSLMILPQNISDENIKLEIKTEYFLPFSDGGPVILEKSLPLKELLSDKLEIGKRYTINIQFTEKDSLTSLDLTCNIKNWNEVTFDVPTFD